MRRIRHLEQCDYIIPINQRLGGQLVALSGHSNCYLERSGDRRSLGDFAVQIHAKFNSADIEGLNIEAGLVRNGEFFSSQINSISISRVDDGDFTNTFIGSFVPTQSGNRWLLDLTQAQLGSNELTSAETYLIEVEALRVKRKYKSFVYFNHLGVFDSIVRLRNQVQFLDIIKVDE